MEGGMHKEDLLIELGVEEIPAGYIEPAMERFCQKLSEEMRILGLDYDDMSRYSTPRRFAVVLHKLTGEQQDELIERIGPTVEMSYDSDGGLTRAAAGFLRGAKAVESDIYNVETDKGPKIAIRLEKKGKPLQELLSSVLPSCLEAMNFPKTMRWGESRMWFARPLRWLVCLYGDGLIDVELNGIRAGRISYGNRYIRLDNALELADSGEYAEVLRSGSVVSDRLERLGLIRDQIVKIERSSGLVVIEDEALLHTIADLVEYPGAGIGNFDSSYLRLPEKIIISTLSQNQKCFALREADGALAARFIFVSNGDPECESIIRHGNEKVISARLADAEFYYSEDTREPLASYVPRLREVLFQKELGSLLEKTERIMALGGYLCEAAGIDGSRRDDILRCAYLSKADLVTQMLGEKEFSKLQGYIGMNYALVSGESEEVSLGIYEHYQPRGQNDALPGSEVGAIVSLADKLDTVCGIIGVGKMPTGSNDPFALRRAANGVVRILAERGLAIDLDSAIEQSYKLLSGKLKSSNSDNILETKEFFRQRINWLLKQAGLGYDVIDSVIHLKGSNIPDILARAIAVEQFRQRADFINLVLGFKRVSNIISEVEDFGEVQLGLLEEAAEQNLYREYRELQLEFAKTSSYPEMLERLVGFSTYINIFFDEVLVNTEENRLRRNRYNLLGRVREEFLKVADLSLLVVEEKR
jgi:glycyl-tRNA synthetase beta chain